MAAPIFDPIVGDYYRNAGGLFRVLQVSLDSVLIAAHRGGILSRVPLPLDATPSPAPAPPLTISALETHPTTALVRDGAALIHSGLPTLASPGDLADALSVPLQLLLEMASDVSPHYAHFTVPKRSGGMREISAPTGKLKRIQRWIVDHILTYLLPSEEATGFRRDRSVVHNAAVHAAKPLVIRVDVEDFFGSIRAEKVRDLFAATGYVPAVAHILTQLSTVPAPSSSGRQSASSLASWCLPQGAPTSPAISNMVCVCLDQEVAEAAAALGFTYTRYADDLVFSRQEDPLGAGRLIHAVRKQLLVHGFTVNEKKTRVMYQHHRQVVTGLVVKTRPHISRQDLRTFRAFLHRYETQGRKVVSEQLGRDAQAYANGYDAFIRMVDSARARQIERRHSWIRRSTPPIRTSMKAGVTPPAVQGVTATHEPTDR